MKFVKQTEKDLKSMWKEIQALRGLKHPNIIEYYGFQITPEKNFIVMELMELGSLEDFLKANKDYYTLPNIQEDLPKSYEWKESQYRKVAGQLLCMSAVIAKGMLYIERCGSVQRDLAARNVLLKQENGLLVLKIADFGLARLGNYVLHSDATWVHSWSAPEIIRGNKTGANYTPKSDVWSFGVTFWEIMNAGAHPRVVDYSSPLEEYIKEMHLIREIQKERVYAWGLDRLFRYVWVEDPKERPNFEQVFQLWTLLLKNGFGCKDINTIPMPPPSSTVIPMVSTVPATSLTQDNNNNKDETYELVSDEKE